MTTITAPPPAKEPEDHPQARTAEKARPVDGWFRLDGPDPGITEEDEIDQAEHLRREGRGVDHLLAGKSTANHFRAIVGSAFRVDDNETTAFRVIAVDQGEGETLGRIGVIAPRAEDQIEIRRMLGYSKGPVHEISGNGRTILPTVNESIDRAASVPAIPTNTMLFLTIGLQDEIRCRAIAHGPWHPIHCFYLGKQEQRWK